MAQTGVGVEWAQVEKTGFNPVIGENVMAQRRVLRRHLKLPMKDEYRGLVLSLLPVEAEPKSEPQNDLLT